MLILPLVLQGVSIVCYAEDCISYGRDVCLSVCLSYAGTESKGRKLSRNLHRLIAEGLLVIKSSSRNWNVHPERERWVGEIRDFQPIHRRISETAQDSTITPFRLVQKSTLGNLQRPLRTLLHKTCVFRSPPRKF